MTTIVASAYRLPTALETKPSGRLIQHCLDVMSVRMTRSRRSRFGAELQADIVLPVLDAIADGGSVGEDPPVPQRAECRIVERTGDFEVGH